MGKQSRRKKERSPGEAKAMRYLAKVGLPERPDPGPYRKLATADPEWFQAVCDADDAVVALASAEEIDTLALLAANEARYRLLYRDLDTALAEYAGRPVMIAAAWLPWWIDHGPRVLRQIGARAWPPTRILDVGCGPGVLTCAYGLLSPSAEVVGIDLVPEAVACAEQLAARLDVRNVSFVTGDVLDPGVVGGEPFDDLVSVAALADAGLYPLKTVASEVLSSVADVEGPGLEFRSAGIDHLVGLLGPIGSISVLERTPDVSQAVRLGAALVGAGVDLDLSRDGSGVETFIEEGKPSTFTRFTGRRAEEDAPAHGAADGGAALAAWLRRAPAPAFGRPWHDELRFEALKADGARLAWGSEIDYSPVSPTLERREIWEHGNAVFGWVTTTIGYRELISNRTVEELWNDFGAYAGRFQARGLNVRFYDKA